MEIQGRPMLWSSRAEDIVTRLIAATPPSVDPWVRTNADRLNALPVGRGLWIFSFPRPNGEVVHVNSEPEYFEPKEDVTYRDRGHVIGALVEASRRYPELVNLLPTREPDAANCPCLAVPIMASGEVICTLCGGLGWLPMNTRQPESDNATSDL